MADPELVGSKIIRPSTAWASSYTITTADLPAGTKVGDRVILWLLGRGSGTGADHPRGVWGLPAVWRDWLAGTSKPSLLNSGYMSKLTTWVNVYSSRYLPDTFPVTISPTKADETPAPTGTFWRGIITVYRPSKEPDALGQISAFNADDTMPGSPPSASNAPQRYADGLCIGVGIFGNASGYYLSTPNGYTDRSSSEAIANGIIHVDCPSSNGSNVYLLPTLSTVDGFGTGVGGVMLFVSLATAADVPDYADEWGVNVIRW